MKTTQFTSIPLPSSPFTESWLTWLVCVLSALYLLLLYIKPPHFNQTLLIKANGRKSLFDEYEQKEAWGTVFLIIFCCSTLSLLYYTLTHPNTADYTPLPYLHIFISFCVFALIKVALLYCVGYVFFSPLQRKIFSHYYQHLFHLICTCLFPLVLTYLYLPESLAIVGLTLISLTLIIGGVLLIIEIFQLFFQNFVAGFYILLYLCTLEILPYYGLFLWIEQQVWNV